MKLALLLPVLLALNTASCVNGKLSPIASQIIAGLDTAACELVTVEVSNVEAGDICKTATGFFNGLLSSLSASMKKATVGKPSKYPVKYQGVTVGHFYRPFDAMVQAKLDDLSVPPDVGSMLPADGGLSDGGLVIR